MPKAAIIGYGRYIPKYRIRTAEIAAQWQHDSSVAESLGIEEKTVPGTDEDAFTLAFEASRQALETSGIEASEVSACYVGSESHPYAVKPTSSMLANALGVNPFSFCADLEFACKAGTAGVQIVQALVESGKISCGLAVGSDTAQSRPGDALEYTAAAGSAALLLGASTHAEAICAIEDTLSYTTDTPDFWRPNEEKYPHHAGRFTGEPGYFHHVRTTTQAILERTEMKPEDFAHVVFHMPNAKFPQRIAKELGFTKEQTARGFVVEAIGNTYSACSLLGWVSVLEHAKKGEKLLIVSYGSGSGCDAFVCTMLKDGVPLPTDNREKEYMSYGQYLRHNRSLVSAA